MHDTLAEQHPASEDPVVKQLKKLLDRIDFDSKTWLDKPQVAKDKLRSKLEKYGIDLDEVILSRTNGTAIPEAAQPTGSSKRREDELENKAKSSTKPDTVTAQAAAGEATVYA